jgi:phenylacetate-CoA ligase
MLSTLNRHLIQPLLALKRGSKHFAYHKALVKSQWLSPLEVQASQWTAVQAQLNHAYATVPYYQRTWAAAGVHPSDIKCLADMVHLPILTKAEIRANPTELHSSLAPSMIEDHQWQHRCAAEGAAR